jgi:nitroreductase/NAD-dependent dihydropyrimidine dehydrogenase PreA subunit
MLEINLEKCTRCGSCAKACSAYVIEFKKETGPIENNPETCILCGHCVAICPVDAIVHTKLNSDDFLPVDNPNISYEQLNILIRNRRSIRRYKKEPLSDEHIDKLLESVKYIPTAENDQELKYLIIRNPEIIMNIKRAMAKNMIMAKKMLKIFFFVNWFLPKKQRANVRVINQRWEKGGESGEEDPFLRNASTLMIIYAKKKNTLSLWDSGIASYNIMLTAETLGIGTVWNGMHAILCGLMPAVKKASMIPKGNKVIATVCLGYPKINYRKTTYRNPLDIKKID